MISQERPTGISKKITELEEELTKAKESRGKIITENSQKILESFIKELQWYAENGKTNLAHKYATEHTPRNHAHYILARSFRKDGAVVIDDIFSENSFMDDANDTVVVTVSLPINEEILKIISRTKKSL